MTTNSKTHHVDMNAQKVIDIMEALSIEIDGGGIDLIETHLPDNDNSRDYSLAKCSANNPTFEFSNEEFGKKIYCDGFISIKVRYHHIEKIIEEVFFSTSVMDKDDLHVVIGLQKSYHVNIDYDLDDEIDDIVNALLPCFESFKETARKVFKPLDIA